MLTSIVLVSSVVFVSQAVIIPDTPVAGDSFNEGTTCPIAWAGDTGGSATAWKNMAIELMTGSSSAMITLASMCRFPSTSLLHLFIVGITVATGQDGTKAGTFEYECPEVYPPSPIYFYQFTAAGTSDIIWTTRFTIAGADGSSIPATETDEQGAPYGNGKLVPPPAGSGSNSSSSVASLPAKPSGTGKISSHPSIPPASSQSESGAASHSTSSPTSSESSTSAAVPASNPSKRKNLAGPIVGGVVGGLALLSALILGFLFCRARRRGQANTPSFASDTESAEKTDDAPWPSYPLPQNSALQVEPEPLITALSSGKTRLFVPNRVPPALLRQGDAPSARDAIQDAGVRALPPVPASGPIRSPEESSSAQLVAEVRLLREQMDAMYRQQQMREPDLELPEYTPDYSGTSG
ncbi:hypothetical protein DFH08DRAFT_955194 [Mycena albidolilacea]|uniref:Mid2 domain-containing protein n=1 Tax=Mycena albidolilacea TaxID=1033008 RepID=A0AAD7ADF9_9AGAR|nr:hypothetical protein DFH08DRAFT_955194 [Mycena albidolilacea]